MKHTRHLLELPPSERLRLVEALWDSLLEVPEAVPVSDELEAELDRRLDLYYADPSSARPWAEIREELFAAGTTSGQHFAVCVRNDDYPASLELRKLYRVLEDAFATEHGLIRVVDESGEDYLYPAEFFVHVALPSSIEKAFAKIP